MPHCWGRNACSVANRSLYTLATISPPDNFLGILESHDLEAVNVRIFTWVSRISRHFPRFSCLTLGPKTLEYMDVDLSIEGSALVVLTYCSVV